MEFESILGYLENKTILITGATGFVGKVLVEKILRVQPNVKKLYLLLRASDANSATHRMHNEITGKELFKIVREKWAANFDSFISEKVVALSGDVTLKDLGVKEIKVKEELFNGIQIIINSAANTKWDERYDVALEVNTFGVLNMLDFAKKCLNLEMVVHMSTAYVSGDRAGLILEDSSSMDEMARKTTHDVDLKEHEKKMVERKLKELQAQDASEEVITNTMKDFGTLRAKLYGWENTYLLTKVMGEMYLGHSKGNISVAVIRPTLITSTYKEPFSGWIEGFRLYDSLIGSYWKGKLACIPVDPMSVVDVIPVDMVVNSIITAMVVNANTSRKVIYHVGTSLQNPLKFSDFNKFMFQYCTNNPWIYNDGRPVKVGKLKMVRTMAAFRWCMQPLQGLKFLNKEFDQCFRDVCLNDDRKDKSVIRLIELNERILLFKGIFDDTNSEELRKIANWNYIDAENFNFNPKCIDWEDYYIHIHIPGLAKNVIFKHSQSRL
ncbi:fatty acyl-CoA reductase 3-like [Rosa sericea]